MDRVLLLFLCLLAQWIYQVSNFKSSFVSITFSSKHISTFSSKTRYPHAHLHIVVSFQFQIHSSLNITAGHFHVSQTISSRVSMALYCLTLRDYLDSTLMLEQHLHHCDSRLFLISDTLSTSSPQMVWML